MRKALVIGCAANVWEDVAAAQALTKFDRVYCVKLAGVVWNGGPFVWVGLHPEFMDEYQKDRRALGLPCAGAYETVGPPDNELGTAGKNKKLDRRVSYRYPGMDASASSGGYAAKVALDDGHNKVILAGVPMQRDAAHFTRGKPWEQISSFTIGFNKSVPHFAGRVRSMSGWTKEILGAPTPDWLNGATP